MAYSPPRVRPLFRVLAGVLGLLLVLFGLLALGSAGVLYLDGEGELVLAIDSAAAALVMLPLGAAFLIAARHGEDVFANALIRIPTRVLAVGGGIWILVQIALFMKWLLS
jgi:hypothetical protein